MPEKDIFSKHRQLRSSGAPIWLALISPSLLMVGSSVISTGCEARHSYAAPNLQRKIVETGLAVASIGGRNMVIFRFDHMAMERREGILKAYYQGYLTSDGLSFVATDLRHERVARLDLEGREIWQLDEVDIPFTSVALSPDGKKVAYHVRSGLYYVTVDSKQIVKMSSLAVEAYDSQYRSQRIAWSPKSDRVVYSSGGKIMLHSVGENESIAFAAGTDPSWSPDGQWIAFRSPDNKAALKKPDGGETTTLADGKAIRGSLRWSPDSRFILYTEKYQTLSDMIYSSLWKGTRDERLVAYQLSDGAQLPVLGSLPTGYGETFGWAKLGK